MSRLCRKTVKWFDIDSPFIPHLVFDWNPKTEKSSSLSPTQSRRQCIFVSVINPLQSPPRLTWSLLNTNPDHQQWSPSLSDKIVFQCLHGAWCPDHPSFNHIVLNVKIYLSTYYSTDKRFCQIALRSVFERGVCKLKKLGHKMYKYV